MSITDVTVLKIWNLLETGKQEEAEQLLTSLGDDVYSLLTEIIKQEDRLTAHDSKRKFNIGWYGVIIAGTALACLFTGAPFKSCAEMGCLFLAGALFGDLIFFEIPFLMRRYSIANMMRHVPRVRKKTRKMMLELVWKRLLQADTGQAVQPLLLLPRTEARSDEIECLLLRLLPKLSRENADALEQNAKSILRGHLFRLSEYLLYTHPSLTRDRENHRFLSKRQQELPLLLTVLRAYAQVTDETVLERITRLARNRQQNRSSDSSYQEIIRQVAEAAQEVLPMLEARLEAQRTSATMLRPSSAPVETKTLLRPTQEKPDREIASLPRIPTTEPANTETQHLLLKSDNGETTS